MNHVSEQDPPRPSDGDVWLLVKKDLEMKYNVKCRHCGSIFESHASASRFCSDLCMFMVNVSPNEHNQCWLWRGKSGKHQQMERTRGESFGVHRFVYELFWGEIEEGKLVRHICNEPSCANPFHLFQGTNQQNSKDMTNARRQAHGERHGLAKLTEEDVRDIRADENATIAELTRRYKVSRGAIRGIRSGRTWQLLDSDMEQRRVDGIAKYGTPLQPNNGRDPLVDAYQECLDMCVYLRQAIEERDSATQ